MYVTMTQTMTVAGRAADYEARQARLQDFVKTQPGFQAGVLSNSLGNPGKYSGLTRWESREAARNYRMSEAFKTFRQANPLEGLSTPVRPMEAYEVIHAVGAPRAGLRGFSTTAEWTITPGGANGEAFQRTRKDLIDLRHKHSKGIVLSRLFRFLGNRNRYVIATVCDTLENLDNLGVAPELQAFAQAHRFSDYAEARPVVERWEILRTVTP